VVGREARGVTSAPGETPSTRRTHSFCGPVDGIPFLPWGTEKILRSRLRLGRARRKLSAAELSAAEIANPGNVMKQGGRARFASGRSTPVAERRVMILDGDENHPQVDPG
jgi:hypothetical protein